MVVRYLEVLWNPESFYERVDRNAGLGPSLVVLVVGIVAAFFAALQTQVFLGVTPGDQMDLGVLSLSVLRGVLLPFVFWVCFGTAFYILSGRFNGTGYLKPLMKLLGWGFFPLIIGRLAWDAAMYFGLQEAVRQVGSATIRNQQQAREFAKGLPIGLVGKVVLILTFVWSAYIWTEAVRQGRHIDRREARIVVGIPVGIWIVYLVWTLVSAL